MLPDLSSPLGLNLDRFIARVFEQKFKAADTANHRIYVMNPSDCTIVYEASLKMKKNSKNR